MLRNLHVGPLSERILPFLSPVRDERSPSRPVKLGLRGDPSFKLTPYGYKILPPSDRIEEFVQAAGASLGISPPLALAVLKIWDPSAVEGDPPWPTPGPSASLETRIAQLYGELRNLVARAAHDTSVRAEIEYKRQALRALQEEEAEQARRRAEARLPFTPAEGYQALARAARLLDP